MKRASERRKPEERMLSAVVGACGATHVHVQRQPRRIKPVGEAPAQAR